MRVLVRVDYNVPLENGKITDDTKIRATLPTIEELLAKQDSLILMSHLGRPKGQKDPSLSLAPCAKRLEELLGRPVQFASDCVGDEVEKQAQNLKPGEILLLENLRFYPAEENPDSDSSFAEKLASLGDAYVNDAFGTAHRKHTSTFSLPKLFAGKSRAGKLMQEEIKFLGENVQDPKRPFFAIIGGAKVSTKLGILKSLIHKVDALFIGGAMAYTFLRAKGESIGNSMLQPEFLEEADMLLHNSIPVFLPIDHVCRKNDEVIQADEIPAGFEGVDIGPETIKQWTSEFQKAKTIFWNGPVGIFEQPPFDKGTEAIALALASLQAITIVGGGDSVHAINDLHLADKFSHISTGGGASLEYIEKGNLPGLDVLDLSV